MSDSVPTPSSDEDALPGAGDRLFEIIDAGVSRQSQFEKHQDWYFFVNGYKDAADLLVAHANEGDPRKLGFPIVFLYRQHLELAFKNLTLECCRALGRDESFSWGHGLNGLWRQCLELVREILPDAVDTDEFKHTTRLVAEFSDVDPTAEAFRYPGASGNVQIILTTVRDVVGKISLFVECVSESISHENDAF